MNVGNRTYKANACKCFPEPPNRPRRLLSCPPSTISEASLCSSVLNEFYNRPEMKILFLLLLLIPFAQSQTPDPHSVPAVDAALGPCSADFTITGSDNKPVYAAKIKVHIAYGFASLHKLDLEVGTNVDGKARFTGLPDRLKKGLFFEAAEGDRTGNAFDDTSKTCEAKFAITLRTTVQAPQ
jgi:hypothetical protein